MSLCGYTDDDRPPPLTRAIDEYVPPGAIVVAAAGNEGSCRPYYPAALAGRRRGRRPRQRRAAPGSRTSGRWVDACAPGVDVVSTFFTHFDDQSATWPSTSQPFRGWAAWSGTSFTAPKVAAAIAHEVCDEGRTSRRGVASPVELAEVPLSRSRHRVQHASEMPIIYDEPSNSAMPCQPSPPFRRARGDRRPATARRCWCSTPASARCAPGPGPAHPYLARRGVIQPGLARRPDPSDGHRRRGRARRRQGSASRPAVGPRHVHRRDHPPVVPRGRDPRRRCPLRARRRATTRRSATASNGPRAESARAVPTSW